MDEKEAEARPLMGTIFLVSGPCMTPSLASHCYPRVKVSRVLERERREGDAIFSHVYGNSRYCTSVSNTHVRVNVFLRIKFKS